MGCHPEVAADDRPWPGVLAPLAAHERDPMAKKDSLAVAQAEVLDEGKLLPNLAGVQMEAAQQEPPLVKLVKAKDPEDESPPKAPTAPPMPAPRFIHPNERAPRGMYRFKIRCLNYGADQPTRYVLAATAEDARRCYLDCIGLSAVLMAVEADGETPPTPRLFVKQLED